MITNSKLKIKNFQIGFTLIELLVVISIIGILAALSLTSFTTSQRQARDTSRKSDLAQYRTQLESFANKNNGLYPASNSAISMSTLCSSGYLNLTGCSLDPKDPTITYRYCTDGATSGGAATATNYVLWTTLENTAASFWTTCSDGKSAVSTSAPTCGASFNCNIQ